MTVARGNRRERQVEQLLRGLGYCTSSRRHVEGPGDLLALAPVVQRHPPLLVEVKATTDPPWRSDWGPVERGAMMLAADAWGVEPILCWWPPGLVGGPVWLTPDDWP